MTNLHFSGESVVGRPFFAPALGGGLDMVDEVGGRAHVDARTERNGGVAAKIDVQKV